MNCEQCRELLIDLAYGELPAADAAGVEAHLAACPSCREELERLRLARRAVGRMLDEAQYTARPLRLAARWRRPSRLLAVGAALAAAVAFAVVLWNLGEKTTPVAYGGPLGPVEIKRVGVSLTILSTPQGWNNALPITTDQAGAQAAPNSGFQGIAYTGGNYTEGGVMPMYTYYASWPGMALVRDERMASNLKTGDSRVSFADVPAGILPDSVRLAGLDSPQAMTILEQNYQYDLASAQAVLAKYIDKTISVSFKDRPSVDNGPSVTGVLLSFDDGSLVVRPPGEGPRTISRKQVKAVAFEKLPEGLLTTPTLVWELRNKAAEHRQQFEVAYLTTGLSWRADYVLKLHPAGQAAGGEITDSADLVGYATVTNNSGVTFQDAQLKLMAGDVNLLMRSIPVSRFTRWGGEKDVREFGLVERSFFEYHLYTLTEPTTLANAETKQLELVSGSGLKMRRAYVYDHDVNPTAARVVSEMENSEANGLGKPLPKGVVRLYAPDPDGVQTYVAQTEIDHTPMKEKLRLPWGYAFDIACERTETQASHSGPEHKLTWHYSLRNHKDHDVIVTVVAHVPPSTHTAACELPWHIREVGVVEIEVPLKADSQTEFDFAFAFNDFSGGGLKSPYDKKQQ